MSNKILAVFKYSQSFNPCSFQWFTKYEYFTFYKIFKTNYDVILLTICKNYKNS